MNTLDTSNFESALRFVIAATGKEEAPLLNKYALQTIIGAKGIPGAMQRTPKADRAKLDALNAGGTSFSEGAKIYSNQYGKFSARASRTINATTSIVRGYVVAKLRKAGKLKSTTSAQIDAYVRNEIQRRNAASGYTAFVGWSPAARAFGGTGAVGAGKPATDARRYPLSEAFKGTGIKATEGHLQAVFTNCAPEAEHIGSQPLQDALDAQAEDMVAYGTQKLKMIFDKVAGKYV